MTKKGVVVCDITGIAAVYRHGKRKRKPKLKIEIKERMKNEYN